MDDKLPYQAPPRDAEVTLADVIRTVQGYIRYLIRKWYWILGAIILGALAGWAFVKFQTIHHIAEITFVANQENRSGGNSILASTLASFGLSSESGSESSPYSKIIALSQSQKIQFTALLDTVVLDDTADLMINHISRIYDLTAEWDAGEPVHFTKTIPDSMDLTRRQYLKRIYRMITKDNQPIYSIEFDNSSEMVNMKTQTINQDLSVALVHVLYENLSQFYIRQSTAKGLEIVNTLKQRKDSLENVLQNQQVRLAVATDRSKGMTYRSQQTNRLDLDVDLNITRTMYMEVVKNLEMSRFNLENIRPVFTIIDAPLKPLSTDRKNQTRMMIIFALVSSVLITMILIFRKMYADVMKEDSQFIMDS